MTLIERYIKVRKQLFDKYYSYLNDMQRKAVYASDGPLLVLAGAGSGKTTVLVQRIAHLIRFGRAMDTDDVNIQNIPEEYVTMLEKVASDENVSSQMLDNALNTFAIDRASPFEILSITFTNKAANEMKERLEKQLGPQALDIWAGTFHSVCARLLRMHIDLLGRDKNFTIYDTDDQKRLMTSCVKELDLNDKMFAPKAVLGEISRAKEKLVDEKEYALSVKQSDIRRMTIARLYSLYEKKKLEANAVDFDDIICLAVKLLKDNPELLEKYRRRFKYILVDEYQDTNKAQFVLTSMLCNENNNIMVVGDDDQSIYKFRGATIENILGFDKTFSSARVIKLEQNYRSTDVIIGAANEVIKNNSARKGKTLWTSKTGGEKIVVKECENQIGEGQYIVDRITDLMNVDNYSFGDFAVLYRMNAQSNSLETVFAKSGIPYRILGGTRFYDRKEIKDIVSYLCVISNPHDNVRIKRIINVPKRAIGDATVEEVEKIASQENISVFQVCKNADRFPSLARSAPKLVKFCDLIEELAKDKNVLSLGILVEKVFEKTGYMQMLRELDEAESKDRTENVKELVSNAVQYQENNADATLEGFLEEVALISDVDNYDKDAPAVVLMTVHSSKGLEFPVVFLPGLEENIFPGSQSVFEESELEEERRLAYVAITRAKNRLFMLHCRSRMTYGKTEFNRRSRFIDEIPETYCTYEGAFFDRVIGNNHPDCFEDTPFGSYRKPQANAFARSSTDYFAKPKNKYTGTKLSLNEDKKKSTSPVEQFSAGALVTHPMFGDGMVISAKKMGSDTLYEVAFDKVGTKKIMGNFAKMTKKQ